LAWRLRLNFWTSFFWAPLFSWPKVCALTAVVLIALSFCCALCWTSGGLPSHVCLTRLFNFSTLCVVLSFLSYAYAIAVSPKTVAFMCCLEVLSCVLVMLPLSCLSSGLCSCNIVPTRLSHLVLSCSTSRLCPCFVVLNFGPYDVCPKVFAIYVYLGCLSSHLDFMACLTLFPEVCFPRSLSLPYCPLCVLLLLSVIGLTLFRLLFCHYLCPEVVALHSLSNGVCHHMFVLKFVRRVLS